MYDFTRTCYLCLNQDNNLILSGDRINPINFQLKFVVPELVLLHPEHPILACNTCHVLLASFYEFKTKCLKVNHYIITILRSVQKTYNGQISQNVPQSNYERNDQTLRTQTTETRNNFQGQDTNLGNLDNRNRQNISPLPHHIPQVNKDINVQTSRTQTIETRKNFQGQDTNLGNLDNRNTQNIPPPPYHIPQVNKDINVQTSRTQTTIETRKHFRSQDTNLVNVNRQNISMSPELNAQISRTLTTEANKYFRPHDTTLVNENRQTQRNSTSHNSGIQEVSASNNNSCDRIYQQYVNKSNRTPQTVEASNFKTQESNCVNKNRQSQTSQTTNGIQNISASNNQQCQENVNKPYHTPWENNYSVPEPHNGFQITSQTPQNIPPPYKDSSNLIRHLLQEKINGRTTELRKDFKPEIQNPQNRKPQQNFTNNEEVNRTVDNSANRIYHQTNHLQNKPQILQNIRVQPSCRYDIENYGYAPITQTTVETRNNSRLTTQDIHSINENRQIQKNSTNQNNDNASVNKNSDKITSQDVHINQGINHRINNTPTNGLDISQIPQQVLPISQNIHSVNENIQTNKSTSNQKYLNVHKPNNESQEHPQILQITTSITQNKHSVNEDTQTNRTINQEYTSNVHNLNVLQKNTVPQNIPQPIPNNSNLPLNENQIDSSSQNSQLRSMLSSRSTDTSITEERQKTIKQEVDTEGHSCSGKRYYQKYLNNLISNSVTVQTIGDILDLTSPTEEVNSASSNPTNSNPDHLELNSVSTHINTDLATTQSDQQNESNALQLLFSNDLKPLNIKQESPPFDNSNNNEATNTQPISETKNIELLFENHFKIETTSEQSTEDVNTKNIKREDEPDKISQEANQKLVKTYTSQNSDHENFVKMLYKNQSIQYHVLKKFTTDPKPDPEDQMIPSVPTNSVTLPLQLYRNGIPTFSADIDMKDNFDSYSAKDDRKFYQELLDTSNTGIKQDVDTRNQQLETTNTKPETEQPEQPLFIEDIDMKENLIPVSKTYRQIYNNILNKNRNDKQTEIKSESVDTYENYDDSNSSTSNQMEQNTELPTDTVLPAAIIQNRAADDTNGKEDLLNESETLTSTIESVVNSFESELSGEFTINERDAIDLMEINDDFVKCRVCNVQLPKRIMYLHMHIHSEFPCKLCISTCRTKHDLETHMRTNHVVKGPVKGNYKCSVCKKLCLSERMYKMHLRVHSDEMPHECSICHKKFHFISGYKSHMYNTHAKEEDKKEKCPQCDKTFLSKGHLHAHIKSHGATKRINFDCKICGKRFVRAENLSQHRRIHKGIKKFECAICNKKFLHKSHLKQHIPTHGGDKEFKCTECDKSFSYSCTLEKHMNVHEKSKTKRRKIKTTNTKPDTEPSIKEDIDMEENLIPVNKTDRQIYNDILNDNQTEIKSEPVDTSKNYDNSNSSTSNQMEQNTELLL